MCIFAPVIRVLLILVVIVSSALKVGAVPFCRVIRYDEYDGLSERRVKQIVQDRDGMIWMATWNGLNRFDGRRFERIRPVDDDDARGSSERFSDIKLTAGGNLWCRIDDKLLMFDVSTYRFTDMSSRLREKLGDDIGGLTNILTTSPESGLTVLCGSDGRYIVMADSMPVETARIVDSKPDLKYYSPGNRKLGDRLKPYSYNDLVFSRTADDGRVWAITRQGEVLSAPSLDSPLETVTRVDGRDGGVFFYSTTDTQGNIWLRNGAGAYCLTFGDLLYYMVPATQGSQGRAFCRDNRGRTWISLSSQHAVACYERLDSLPMYLTPDGTLSSRPAALGEAVYSMAAEPDGRIWLGTKPSALMRLTPRSDDGGASYTIDTFRTSPDASPGSAPMAGGVYDIEIDPYGRLWLATLGGGIDVVESPGNARPRFVHLGHLDSYPSLAARVRDIAIAGDSMIVAATTGGLLAFPLPGEAPAWDNTRFNHLVSRPGQSSSLGNIATMHIMPDQKGNIFIATESDGVNMLAPGESLTNPDAKFVRYNSRNGTPGDVAYSLAVDSRKGTLWTLSSNTIYNIDRENEAITSFPAAYWQGDMHFSDARPIPVGDNDWLVGLEDGVIVIDFDKLSHVRRANTPVVFTSVSVENRADSLISAHTDTITLRPDERNLTVNFSVLSFGRGENFRYSFRLDDGGWNNLGDTRSVTLLDLSPGRYHLSVKASDSSGSRDDSVASLVIIVTPTIWETPLAYFIYVLLGVALIAAIIGTVLYIRRMRRRQHDLLEAYMRLVESPHPASAELAVPTHQLQPSQPSSPLASAEAISPLPLLSEADEQFMQKVMDYVNANLGNADAGVDGMAAFTATSRSSLNRKMKSLFGVTPSDFIKESRLKRAAVLLAQTDMTVTDIAVECGFADINYFGKCFKASRKVSPSTFRKENTML